jgi:hypothetical protein
VEPSGCSAMALPTSNSRSDLNFAVAPTISHAQLQSSGSQPTQTLLNYHVSPDTPHPSSNLHRLLSATTSSTNLIDSLPSFQKNRTDNVFNHMGIFYHRLLMISVFWYDDHRIIVYAQ